MRILLTGAAGFIGFHTAKRLLERGDSVVGIDSVNAYYDPELKFARLAELGIGREAERWGEAVASAKYPRLRFIRMKLEDREAIETLFKEQAFDRVINLAAQAWGAANIGAGDRILLSTLEHHSNIVPWRMLADRVGASIDVAPLTEDGRIDEDALIALLRPETKLVAVAHVSNVLGSIADIARIARAAHAAGARLLVDGCQAVARLKVDVRALGADFYAFSGHKLYGPTGIGALWAKAELLAGMPPWQGGGAMIDEVYFDRISFAAPPLRFEAGTPHIVGAIGLDAAVRWVEQVGIDNLHAHEEALVLIARETVSHLPGLRLFGPANSAGILSFAVGDVHPHDVATILDEGGVAIRAGHHCAQPLMRWLGVQATARASFSAHNTEADVAMLAKGIERTTRIFA